MVRLYMCITACFGLLFGVCAGVGADSWRVVDYYPQADPGSIVFSYNDDVLSINRTSVFRQGGSSGGLSVLHFSGIWGVMSRSTAVYDPDPMARFVMTGDGSGYVDWAAEAPHGYQSYLLLGHWFEGNGAQVYHRTYPPEYDVAGTLVLGESFGHGMVYDDVYHTFEVVNTPEPGGMLPLAGGLAGMVGLLARRRKLG